jgi:MYXO-CTERM domain-containing protein
VPGPESVVVVANSALTGSVALAEAYMAARQVPARQLCALELPDRPDITLDEVRTLVLAPLEACLTAAGVLDRIEAVLLVRGVPLRVSIPVGAETKLVSLAAAVGLWHTELNDGNPLLGEPPGNPADCGGTPCYAAAWSNPFRRGAFDAGWSADSGRVLWRPLLVTMLHGRSFADATRLIDSAVEAERLGGAPGEFVFMDGADPARAALDSTYDAAMTALLDRGFTLVSRGPFNADLTGHHLAAFFTGGATLGMTIEGNTYAPGSLVDNLTSYGAVPVNFERTGESQVSIARWVALGVAGVHGTTDEPLNNVFPSRLLIVDYVDGSTLAEAFHRRLPYVYWHNLVLGDPMCAPYAPRPVVALTGAVAGETIAGSRRVTAHATDSTTCGVARMRLFVDGIEAAAADGDTVEACVAVPAGDDIQLLAVAQLADDGTPQGQYRPKGWTELRVRGVAGPSDCPGADADADADSSGEADAEADAGADADAEPDAADGGTPDDGEGCGCRTAGSGTASGPGLLFVLALLLRRRRG